MATINMAQIVMALALAAVLLQGTTAEDHTVGDSTGWTNNLLNNSFYAAWAANLTFEVGDKLVFTFTTGRHDVATVTKAAYDACTTANPVNTIQDGPATVPLNASGAQYFICTFGSHCRDGQKLAINVTSPNSPPTTGTTSPPPPPPTGGSASSRGNAFAFVLMSLATAFLC